MYDSTLLYIIHYINVENTLFEDDNDANIFCVFNSTQVFLHLKKDIIDRCGTRENILFIILSRNDHFKKYFFSKKLY